MVVELIVERLSTAYDPCSMHLVEQSLHLNLSVGLIGEIQIEHIAFLIERGISLETFRSNACSGIVDSLFVLPNPSAELF